MKLSNQTTGNEKLPRTTTRQVHQCSSKIRNKRTHLSSDLVAALASLNMYNLAHLSLNFKVSLQTSVYTVKVEVPNQGAWRIWPNYTYG